MVKDRIKAQRHVRKFFLNAGERNQPKLTSVRYSEFKTWSVDISYTENIADLLNRHKMRLHLYADDTALFASCRAEEMHCVEAYVQLHGGYCTLVCIPSLTVNAKQTEAIV